MSTQPYRERLHGLDLLRLASFVAIAYFHISLIHYYEVEVPLAKDSLLARGIEIFARSLSFSGFTIAFLTSVLTGLSGTRLGNRLRLFSFLFAGWLVFSALMSPAYGTFLAWDIYPLLFAGVATATLAELAGPRTLRALGVLGFTLLWIPFWEFAHLLDLGPTAANVFGFADCTTEIAEWPVLPWVGLVWAGYAAGVEFKRTRAAGQPAAFSKGELATWGLMLAAGTPLLGAFYGIPLGSKFSCAAYRMPPATFWAHFVWPVFLIRLSLAPGVQAFLARRSFARWVSRLAISRKFWAAYLLHYLIAHVLSLVAHWSGTMGGPYETNFTVLLAIVFLPMTELSTRAVAFGVDRFVLPRLAARRPAHVPAPARGR